MTKGKAPQSRSGMVLLRRADQLTVAVLSMAGLAAMAAYWFVHGGHRGELIEVERARPQTAAFKIDVNTAEWPEFTLLPGIGETLARRIVESREQQGPFAAHEDLRRVRGIGPVTVDRIRGYLHPLPPGGAIADHEREPASATGEPEA